MKRSTFSLLLVLAAQAGAVHGELTDEQRNFFERKIRPVLVEQCYECHSTQSKKVKGGLMLDTKEATLHGGDTGPAVVPGKITDSLLIEAIRYGNKDMEMPPKGKLPASVIADFEAWVKMGAPDPRGEQVADAGNAASQWKKKDIDVVEGRKFWAYQPPKKSPVPEVKNTAWPRSDLDRYILAKLEEKGLQPVADAQKLDLLRRVTFDLTGLPPTLDQIQAFMKDASPEALTRVVDNLLASERFGEYWGRHWLDVARYAESSGKDINVPYPFAWRYRDWVIGAFNEDMPYNEFIRQQVAGDLLPFKDAVDQSKKIVATGFLAIGTKPHNERNPRQFALEVADEQIDTLTQAVLGTTVACARCHDHKFDPIPQKDYYALAGIFLSSETLYGTNGVIQNNQPSDLIELGRDSGMAPGFEGISASARADLARRMKQLDDTRAERQQEAMAARRSGKEIDAFRLLAVRQQTSELKGQINRYAEDGSARILAMGVYERRTPVNSPLFNRGEATQPGEMVPRGFVQVMFPSTPPQVTKGSGRLDLANWLASTENPQTARVMVNRMWRWLFGRGIVASVDNFGAMGEKPSHPELLDWLALRFMENGWSVKKMVREIVLSRTYQLSSQHAPQNFAADPDNTLFWRMSTRGLDAESLRDAMLSVSGEIDFYPPPGSPVSRVTGEGREAIFRFYQATQQPTRYRSVYLPLIRDVVPEALALFDFANPALVTGDRETTNVPSQSLYLMNNAQVIALSDAFARRVYDSSKDNPTRVVNAYWLAFGRAPTQQEILATRTFFSEYAQDAAKAKSAKDADITMYAWSAFCQALMASAEFRFLN
ncbi:cytochrome c [Roseimicrobium gellanilyticum]|uniref:Cytochrome c n=1 Tax=Roseimicrobium gellanilyticum TaxID=748857 RepID=A0A366HDI2_9BACT|nr:PSD1 and planctomycete cytochrome C domain-containing protein [Roseimicrobium gellanilyticum]RBP40437.1 cytochrome c [Roseimicrobium gellanilyticum]